MQPDEGGLVRESSFENAWQEVAGCRGPASALFFAPVVSERREDREIRESRAKAICAECPVSAQCLDFAMSSREQHGIWGGKNEAERRLMLLQPSSSFR